jgi:hypothetical protein
MREELEKARWEADMARKCVLAIVKMQGRVIIPKRVLRDLDERVDDYTVDMDPEGATIVTYVGASEVKQ